MISDYKPFRTSTAATIQKTPSKVLLIDACGAASEALRKSLTQRNCDVISAKTVLAALSFIKVTSFDILVIDLHVWQVEDGPPLMAAWRYFQSRALVVAVSDSLDLEQLSMTSGIKAHMIVKPSMV